MEPRVPFAASCDPTTAALLAHTFTLAPVMITADEGQGLKVGGQGDGGCLRLSRPVAPSRVGIDDGAEL